MSFKKRSFALLCLMDLRDLKMTQSTHFSLLTHISNFYQWYFIIQLHELELVFRHTAMKKWTDRWRSWNHYLNNVPSVGHEQLYALANLGCASTGVLSNTNLFQWALIDCDEYFILWIICILMQNFKIENGNELHIHF